MDLFGIILIITPSQDESTEFLVFHMNISFTCLKIIIIYKYNLMLFQYSD